MAITKTPTNKPPNKPTKSKENPLQVESSIAKKALTPRPSRKAQAKPTTLPRRNPTPLREEAEKYDKQRCRNANAKLLYDEVIKHEEIVEFRVFNYMSLDEARLYLFMDFIFARIYKFYGYSCNYYPEMFREFYSNIWVNEETKILKSYVNRVEMALDEALLAELFCLNDSGKMCNGQEFSKETPEGPTDLANVYAMAQNLLRLFNAPGVEIRMKVLDPKDLGIQKRMFHWALLKSIKAKVHSQLAVTKG